MVHYSRLYKIVIDVPEVGIDEEVAFWQAASGRSLPPNSGYPEYHGSAVLPGQEFALLIQQLGQGPARVHIDIHTDDLDAEIRRLERLGAQCVVAVHDWQVMRDPAGLLFCVIPDREGTLTDENAQRWD